MRVTKVIREYIEEKVCERLPLPKKVDNLVETEFNELRTKLADNARAGLMAFLEKHQGQFSFHWNGDDMQDIEKQKKCIESMTLYGCGQIVTKADKDHKKQIAEIEKQRKSIIKDIIVTLELGGTKAELEEMLSKVGE